MSEQMRRDQSNFFACILFNYKRRQAHLFERLEQSPLFGVARLLGKHQHAQSYISGVLNTVCGQYCHARTMDQSPPCDLDSLDRRGSMIRR